jgi:hypothetical protein
MNEQNALATGPLCGAAPEPVHGDQIIGISEPFRGIRTRVPYPELSSHHLIAQRCADSIASASEG